MADLPVLPDRAHAVLGVLLARPNASHPLSTIAAVTGLTYPQVDSVAGLLVGMGWAIRRDEGGVARPLALTSTGRDQARGLVEAGTVGVPLADVDRTDPQLADRARVLAGLPPKHRQT